MKRSTLLSLSLALAGLASGARADWADDFSGGQLNQPWVFFDNSGTSPPDATVIDASSNALLLVGDPALAGGGNFDQFAIGLVGFMNPAFVFEDVTVRADVTSLPNASFDGTVRDGNNDSFVMARVGSNGTDSYLLALDFNSGGVDLVRVDPGPDTNSIASNTIAGFDPTSVYTLELIAMGSSLTGNVYNNGILVTTVSNTDSAYSSGWAGVGTAINDNASLGAQRTLHAAAFDNTSAVVPEPAGLLCVALSGLALFRRRC